MTGPSFRLENSTPDTLAVSGELTFQTAARALSEATAAIAGGGQTRLDLAGLVNVDSAGLACVLAVVARARGQGRPFHVVNAPAGLRTLAQVADVDGLIMA
jgi:phospholipid transport system transporter-binding protein